MFSIVISAILILLLAGLGALAYWYLLRQRRSPFDPLGLVRMLQIADSETSDWMVAIAHVPLERDEETLEKVAQVISGTRIVIAMRQKATSLLQMTAGWEKHETMKDNLQALQMLDDAREAARYVQRHSVLVEVEVKHGVDLLHGQELIQEYVEMMDAATRLHKEILLRRRRISEA